MFCGFPQIDERYIMPIEVQWNIYLTKCQETREMGSLYQGFLISRFFTEDFVI